MLRNTPNSSNLILILFLLNASSGFDSMGKCYPTVSDEYQKAVEKARRKLRGFIADKKCAPLMLRLA